MTDNYLAHWLARRAQNAQMDRDCAEHLEAASARIRELSMCLHVLQREANEAADFLERRAEDYLALDHEAGRTGALQLGLRVAPLRAAAAERRTT